MDMQLAIKRLKAIDRHIRKSIDPRKGASGTGDKRVPSPKNN